MDCDIDKGGSRSLKDDLCCLQILRHAAVTHVRHALAFVEHR